MTVFKGFLLIAKRNLMIFVTYLGIFFVINILYTLPGFDFKTLEKVRVSIGIVDLDQSTLSKGLSDYLAHEHQVTDLADDKAVLQERLLYRDVVYIITVPQGFERSLPELITLDVTKVCDIEQGHYVDQMVGWYLSCAKTLSGAGYEAAEIVELLATASDIQSDVSFTDTGGARIDIPPYTVQFTVMPYVVIAITGFSLGAITMEFYKPDILRRLRASAVSSLRRNVEFLFGYVVFGLIIWVFFNLTPLLLYTDQLLSDSHYSLLLVNTLLLVLNSLSITAVLGLLIRRQEALTPVVNLLSLGMSFLCGVFVELDVLSDKLIAFSRFLPVYWYESVLHILTTRRIISAADQTQLLYGLGLQLLFAAVFLALALVLGRIRSQEN